MTPAQLRQINLLQDLKWHNLYNNGIKGLNKNSLDSLKNKGIVDYKIEKDPTKDENVFGKKYLFHPDRDIYYRLHKLKD